jgi:hypothetical protein
MFSFFAVYRSDCTLASNPMCFTHHAPAAFYRRYPDDKDLLKLKEICEQVWPMCDFAIVPVNIWSKMEPNHWDDGRGWWARHCELNNMENLLKTPLG